MNQALETAASGGGYPSNEITRRTFLKRTGGATVASLVAWNMAAERAKAETGDGSGSESGSNSSVWMMPGIERFEPLSMVDFPNPSSVEIVDAQNNVVAILRASVMSPVANAICVLMDAVVYAGLAELYQPNGTQRFPLGGTIETQRVFGAYRSGNAIPVAEINGPEFKPKDTPQGVSADAGHDIQLAGETVKLYVETWREFPEPFQVDDGGMVTLNVRGVLKKKVNGVYVSLAETEWVSRTTKWTPCMFDGNE